MPDLPPLLKAALQLRAETDLSRLFLPAMPNPTPLSPAAQAVWEAFNQDEAGVFVDYGDKLAAALRAAADQAQANVYHSTPSTDWGKGWKEGVHNVAQGFRAIAAELEGAHDDPS